MLPPSLDTKKEKIKDILLALHWAAMTSNVGLIKFSLDHGVPTDSVINGFVPLQIACINDSNIAAVQYLIDRGADVNLQKWSKKYSVDKTEAVQGATGSTALHVACANGCVKIVDLLLRNHAHVDVKDKYGSTPLDIAHAKNETEIVKLLMSAQKRQVNHDNPASLKPKGRRPSLPSILEHNHPPILHNIHSLISMTPSSSINSHETPPLRNLSTHRPSSEGMHTHSCPTTPRTSMDYYSRHISHGSEDNSSANLSSSPQSTIFDPYNQKDCYGYGVINPYDDDNYLISLERRAYNLPSTGSDFYVSHRRHISSGSFATSCTTVSEEGGRHNSMDSGTSKKSVSDVASPSDEGGFDGDDDSSGRPSVTSDSEADTLGSTKNSSTSKRKWLNDMTQSVENITRRSLDLRPNLENLTQFAKRGVPHIKSNDEESSDDDQQHKGFFSRWAPAWSKK